MVKVKICGITNLSDAQAALRAGADALGFVFAKSPRQVTPEKANIIIARLGPFVTTVGVFVNERPNKIRDIAARCGLSIIQLHGDETLVYTKKLGCCKVIKAFRVDSRFDFREALKFKVAAYLLDTKVAGKYGGSGQRFDWAVMRKALSVATGDAVEESSPIIISGGLHPGNVREAVKIFSPYGVDVSSGVEKRLGIKDHKLMKEFIRNAKKV